MRTYPDHNDREGLEHRLLVLTCHAERERYLALRAEADAGEITLFISRHDLQLRLREAARMRGMP